MARNPLRFIALGALLFSVVVASCSSSDLKKVPPAADAGDAGEASVSGAGGARAVGVGDEAGSGGQSGPVGAAGGSANEGGAAGEFSASGGAPSEAGTGGVPDAPGAAGCGSSTLPDLTTGEWHICNAVAGAKTWIGVLLIASETPTCEGATLSGSFHWKTTTGSNDGVTSAKGKYDSATRQIVLAEADPTNPTVVDATDTMTYDPKTDQLVNGSWVGGTPGKWSAAPRAAAGSLFTCQ